MKRLGLWKMDLTAIDDPETDNMSGTELSNISTPVSPPQQTLTTAEIIRELERQQMEELQPDPIDLTPGFFQKTQMRLKRWHRKFFDTSSLPGEDYYVGYFTADLFVFILTIIFWPSFSGDLSVAGNNLEFLSAVIYQNAVPQLFVAILVTNFVLILVDRAIYVSKSVKAKLVMQFVTVIAFSIWIFFVLPPSNGAPFSSLQGLQVWFLTKTIYWYFSAKQIKMGFPDVRLANFFLRNHSQLNNYAFMIFRSIPFVWEFRSLTDWTLADTCLDLYNWLKFEDIFANLYVVQNTRAFQKQDPRMFGEPQKRGFKYICGGLSVTGLVILIWFPLILLSIPGAKKPHPIGTLKFSMQLSGFQPLYTQMLPAGGIQNLTDSQFADLRSQGDISSLFPSYLVTGTMQHALLPPSSLTSWLINPPAQQELLRTLRNPNESFYLITNYEFDKAEVSLPQTTRGQFFASLTNETRYELANAIESNEDYAVMIPNAYPRFLRALASGSVQNLAPDWRPYLVNATLKFRKSNTTVANITANGQVWWEVYETPTFENPAAFLNFYVLNDAVPALSTISSYGIIGLYVAVVFAVGRFLRIIISGLTTRIMYEDLPNPAPVLKICSDCVLAREFQDFDTEETLYWHLITLFRSPEALFQKTKIKRE